MRDEPPVRSPREREEPEPVGALQVQVSWEPGRVVAWGGGPGHAAVDGDAVMAMLGAAGAPTSAWIHHTRGAAAARCRRGRVRGTGRRGPGMAGRGRRGTGRRRRAERAVAGSGGHLGGRAHRTGRDGPAVAATPAAPRCREQLQGVVLGALDARARRHRAVQRVWPTRCRAACSRIDPSVDARALTRSALTGMVDAICRDSARRVEVPASPPNVRTADRRHRGVPRAPRRERVRRAAARRWRARERSDDWARSVTSGHAPLIVRLDPPDRGDAWNLAVFAPGEQGSVGSDRARDRQRRLRTGATLEDEMARLERMVPALKRPGGTRRGQVILSQDEAWELMATTGPRLAAAGFDVRVPELSPHRPTPMLRVFAEASASIGRGRQPARRRPVVGGLRRRRAHRRPTSHSWRKEARPLIRSGGRWVAIDRADLNAAAAALAERASTTQLSGADMLRLALGLEGSPLAGGISVEGGGWAADLLAAAANLSAEPAAAPERLRRRAAQLSGRGVGVARLPRRGRARRLPGARHGARQDADDARAPPRRRR